MLCKCYFNIIIMLSEPKTVNIGLELSLLVLFPGAGDGQC